MVDEVFGEEAVQRCYRVACAAVWPLSHHFVRNSYTSLTITFALDQPSNCSMYHMLVLRP